MLRDEILGALKAHGIPANLLADFPKLPAEARAILIYGSQARGDAVTGSDLDVLVLINRSQPSIHSGDVNVSFYTPEQLSTGIGTLFGAHLSRDGKVLWDSSGHLTRHLSLMGAVDTDRLFMRALHMSELFTSPAFDLPKYLFGLTRQARYLLRSCLYAQAIRDGQPCFSVREIAHRQGDPYLADLLGSRQAGEASVAELESCLSRLRHLIGEFPLSQHGSLEATLVNEWGRHGDLLSMAFMALGATGGGSDYAEVDKILL